MGLAESGTVSERHEAARADETKLTAGHLAKMMRAAGMAVTARELSAHATEWHHAGWNPSGGMGRCYFFRRDIDATPQGMARLFGRVVAARAEAARPRFGWAVAFREYRGSYGRKCCQPIACVRRFEPGEKMPKKFEAISEEDFAALEPYDGQDLQPYESRASFTARMTKAQMTKAQMTKAQITAAQPAAQPKVEAQ